MKYSGFYDIIKQKEVSDVKKNNIKGFTLVELIVVMVILAILAGLLVPSLIGYIDKANEKKVIADARQLYVSAQTAITEQYGIHRKEYKASANKFRYNGQPCGRVSTNALYSVQRKKTNAGSVIDNAIAKQMLIYLDSLDYDTAEYKFVSSYNPMGDSLTQYKSHCGGKDQPGILVAYNPKGKVEFLEYGCDGYLVHVDEDGYKVTKDGKFTNGPR